MKVKKLRLKNFRCFSELELDLNEKLIVLVAENGQGKSTLLDAIRIALWPYVASFDLARSTFNDPGNSITVNDVRMVRMPANDMARQLPTEVIMSGDYGSGSEVTWGRYRDSEAKATKTKDSGYTSKLKASASGIQDKIRQPGGSAVALPVFGYYGTGRLWSQKRLMEKAKGKDNTKDPDFYIRTFAYQNCLDPGSTYKHFKEWYIWASESLNEQLLRKLRGKHEPEELRQAQDRVSVVQGAVDIFLKPITGWHTLEYSITKEKSLILYHEDQGFLEVEQLSDGIRSVLAMVGDIAYRCIKLNPHLGVQAAKKTKGVVMIDEVDMHLHPRWQQVILGQLQEAFPHVQFIVTTHSPQVLSTVAAKSIRVLATEINKSSGEQHIQVHTPGRQTQGVASSNVLAEIMGTDPVPNIDIIRILSDYQSLIQQDLEVSPDALSLRSTLEDHYGLTHPVLLECDRMIRLQALKRRKSSKRDTGEG
ncbi:hypothetical protein BZG06_15040 [Salinivibrio kushneri]|uniref:ATP-binding protein n=1 Tax=Salinivibrio kushneri TaxID=1908198 RepID=A0AB36JZ05_9GAMM|nr:AAA family ATPase [Salinivibrio kushneri]OOE40513.1 hypothetical protein BZG06_15040 [Salinivibrio kushneri]OOE40880.1 hypothetical protein BZG09_16190 [Salinivibrio kushneri]